MNDLQFENEDRSGEILNHPQSVKNYLEHHTLSYTRYFEPRSIPLNEIIVFIME